MPTANPPLLVRVAEQARDTITLTIDGEAITALAGDTLLTALLINGRHVRVSPFGDGPRAGFCMMGSCQDCWVSLEDGRRLRACTTPAEDRMALRTGA